MAVATGVSPRVLDVRALADEHASQEARSSARAAIDEAAELLRRGGLVALPTETVYGLGAHALDEDALARIFAAKGRPTSHPLIAHVLDLDGARAVADDVDRARVLTDVLWPGPLTVVLPRAARAPGALSGGLPTVAVRAPAHPVARALIAALGAPIAAPSANRYQHVSPTTAAHVVRSLGDAVELVLDGGPTQSGIESTVVDLIGAPRVLRPGPLSLATLRTLLPSIEGTAITVAADEARASPGLDARHYAPGVPASLFTTPPSWRAGEGALLCGARYASAARAAGVHVIVLALDAERYAAGLYAALHELDAAGLTHIHVEAVPADERWDAVRDRVTRAAYMELGSVGGAQKS